MNLDVLVTNPGDHDTLKALIVPVNADFKKVIWKSNKNSVATVSATGIVKSVRVGEAFITATTTEGNYTDTCSILVTQPSADNSRQLNKS